MTSVFTQQKQQVEQTYGEQLSQLQTLRQEAEKSLRSQARQQISSLESQKQQVLAEVYKQEELSRRQQAIGGVYIPLTETKRGIESKAAGLQETTKTDLERGLKSVEEQVKEGQTSLSKWKQEAIAGVKEAEVTWRANNVELNSGEWVPKKDFEVLPADYQAKLTELGVDKFNEAIEAEQTQFEAENIQLPTGEWTSREKYDALSPENQTLLRQIGVDEFNASKTEAFETFRAENVEIIPEVWFSKSEWNKLTTEQQTLMASHIKEIGLDAWTEEQKQIQTDPEYAFESMQASGDIPKFAKYEGIEEATGSVKYSMPDFQKLSAKDVALSSELKSQAEEEYLTLDAKAQRAIALEATGYAYGWDQILPELSMYLPASGRAAIIKDQQERILSYYHWIVRGTLSPTETIEELQTAQAKELKSALISIVPIVGTIYNWDAMSPTWRAISIATDILILAPFVRAAVRIVKAARAPIATAAANLAKAEQAASKMMSVKLKASYGATVSRSYQAITKAQTAYLKQLAKAAELTRAGKAVPQARLLSIAKAEQTLRTAATRFVKTLNTVTSELKGIGGEIPIRFDSPEIARLIGGLSDDVVRNTKAAVAALASTKADIKALQTAVNNAEAALRAAQARHPTDASKWADLMYKLTEAQAKLAVATTGDIEALYSKLIAARKAGKLEEAARLQVELDKAINSMEIEWAKGGFLSRGGVDTLVAEPPTLTPRLTAPAIRTALPVTIAASIAARTLSAAGEAVLKEWTTPEIIKAAEEAAKTIPQIGIVTTPEVIATTETALEAATKAALEGKTDIEIEAATLAATEIAIRPLIANEVVTQAQAQTMTEAIVKTVVKVATQTALRTRPKPKPLRKEKKEKKPKLEAPPIVPDGTWAWKQGFGWRWYPPPYDAKKPYFSFYPPVDAKNTHLRTPEETIQIIGDPTNVPDQVGIDLGVVDILLLKSPNPTITFKGKGLVTVAGNRIPSTTQGLGVPAKWNGKLPGLPEIKLPSPKLEAIRLPLGPFEVEASVEATPQEKDKDEESQPGLAGVK